VPGRKKKLKPPQPPRSASIETSDGETRIQITPPAADGGSPVIAYSLASMPNGRRIVLEGWDVIHPDASGPVSRTITGYALNPGSMVAVSAENAAGDGKPVILKVQR
jgi:hypothetical protein